jgi:uncharacterized protein YjbI with pentapeptide repeats
LPDQQAVELLTKSVKRFNEWKSVRPGAVDLDGANLSGARIIAADLSGASLRDADLSGADLSGANLQGAVLYRTQGAGAVLARCRMDEAYAAESNFEGADMSQVRATGTNFSRAVLQAVRFDHARLLNVSFEGADLTNARMVGALLVGTELPEKVQVDLKEAVIDNGKRGLPPLPSVDFKWISEDGLMFTIGRWTPRPDAADDQVSSFVLNLRKFNRNDPEVLKGYAKLIARLSRTHHIMSQCDTVCAVPGSKSEDTDTAVTRLSEKVAEIAGVRDGTHWLIRHKSVLPSGFLSFGPSEGKHLDSVRVAHSELIDGRTILLLDDFIDSGATMRACRHLLLAVGAKKVICLALGLREHDPL